MLVVIQHVNINTEFNENQFDSWLELNFGLKMKHLDLNLRVNGGYTQRT